MGNRAATGPCAPPLRLHCLAALRRWHRSTARPPHALISTFAAMSSTLPREEGLTAEPSCPSSSTSRCGRHSRHRRRRTGDGSGRRGGGGDLGRLGFLGASEAALAQAAREVFPLALFSCPLFISTKNQSSGESRVNNHITGGDVILIKSLPRRTHANISSDDTLPLGAETLMVRAELPVTTM
jgi:hypothetical protein